MCRHNELNTVKFLGWLKKFGPAQNILGPVKGQGIGSPATTNSIYLDHLKILSFTSSFLGSPQMYLDIANGTGKIQRFPTKLLN